MKKTIVLLLIITVLSTTVMAANGDVAGYIYSTDIRAFINGVEVQSYNIGGRTAVVIEDIIKESSHRYVYDDALRTLKFFSLSPECLVEHTSARGTKPGKVVGRIYKTDIEASIYDVAVPSYNIGGKTAVVIEDLGCDGGFSSLGGRYVWNQKDRTISLEFMYKNFSDLPENRNIKITANQTMTEAEAVFEELFHCGGVQTEYAFPENAAKQVVMPIKSQGETIGYYFHYSSENSFVYWYPQKVKEAEKATCIPCPSLTREGIIAHFVDHHSVGEPKARFDTEEYSFVYISVAGTSWTSYNLVQAYDDGTYTDYGKIINTRNRSPHNLVIDEENEKVTFRYVDRYTSEWFTNYEIDLKAGEIKAVE